MAFTERVAQYIKQLEDEFPERFYVPRAFRRAEDWDKWSTHEWRGHRFGDEPTLETVLQERRVVVLGEPGAGKSTVAAAVIRVAIKNGQVPVFVRLREYRSDLQEMLQHAIDKDVLAEVDANAALTKLYVFDGFDEIPVDLISAFIGDVATLEARCPNARLILTSRQAFYVNRQRLFQNPLPAFYLLDFDDDDIKTFIAHRGVPQRPFMDAVHRAGISQELNNPFALGSLLTLFIEKQTLGKTRADAVAYVVDTDTSWKVPRMLHGLMRMIDRYELRLSDQAALVHATRAREGDSKWISSCRRSASEMSPKQ